MANSVKTRNKRARTESSQRKGNDVLNDAVAQKTPAVEPRRLEELSIDNNGYIDKLSKISKAQKRRSVTMNVGESPLSWLFAHGHLSERQYIAGEKLRTDYERAAMGANITMSWNNMPPSNGRRGAPGHMDESEAMINAKRRFDDAIAILGEGLDNIAWRVICNCESVSTAEKALGWPTRSGKLVLKLALDRLVHHYHIR